MRKLDQYLFAEWSKAFLIALLSILGILLLEDINDDLPDFLKYGASPIEIIQYYLWLTPSFLPVLVPVALLVSLLFVLTTMHRNNEIIAMRSVGMSVFQITRTLWITGGLLTLLLFLLNALWIPHSVEQARLFRDNLRFESEARALGNDAQVGLIHHLTFENRESKRIWIMNRFSEYSLRGYGLNVYFLDEANRETMRVMASEAYYDEVKRHWVMQRGRIFEMDAESGSVLRALPFDSKAFESLDESPLLMRMLYKESKLLSLIELGELLRRIPLKENPNMAPHAVRYYSILASPFSCLIVVAIAIPFALSGVRTNPMVRIAKSVFLFFFYYLLSSLFEMLGSQQHMAPFVAAWMPNAIMLGVAVWLNWSFMGSRLTLNAQKHKG